MPQRGQRQIEPARGGVTDHQETARPLAEHVQRAATVQGDIVRPPVVPAIDRANAPTPGDVDHGDGVPTVAGMLGQRHTEPGQIRRALVCTQRELVGKGIDRDPTQFPPRLEIVIPQRMVALLHDDHDLTSRHSVSSVVPRETSGGSALSHRPAGDAAYIPRMASMIFLARSPNFA